MATTTAPEFREARAPAHRTFAMICAAFSIIVLMTIAPHRDNMVSPAQAEAFAPLPGP